MAPKTSEKALENHSKAQKNISKIDNKTERSNIHIYKVLKRMHPETGVSSKIMSTMNRFVNDIFESFTSETSTVAYCNKRLTITSKEV